MAAPACASSRYGRESAHGRGLICIGTLQRARHALGSRSVPNQHSRPVARRSAGTSRVRGARHARRPAQARTGALHGRACCAAPLGVHAHNVVPAYRLRRHARLQLHDLLRSAATWTASHGTPRASTRPRVSRPSSKAPERGWPEGAALRPACLGQRCGFPQRRARTAPRQGSGRHLTPFRPTPRRRREAQSHSAYCSMGPCLIPVGDTHCTLMSWAGGRAARLLGRCQLLLLRARVRLALGQLTRQGSLVALPPAATAASASLISRSAPPAALHAARSSPAAACSTPACSPTRTAGPLCPGSQDAGARLSARRGCSPTARLRPWAP